MAARSRVKRSQKTSAKRTGVKRAGAKRTPKKRVQKKQALKKTTPKTAVKKSRRAVTPAGAGLVEAALATFAHEVRTPLTGILAISSLLATSELGERERRWVETIKVGAEHLAALASLFVDAARRGNSILTIREDFFSICERWYGRLETR